MKKETMLENINKEIDHLNNCIRDLEHSKQFIFDLDDDMEHFIKENSTDNEENLLSVMVDGNRWYLLYSKYTHLYLKTLKTNQ